MKNKNKPYEFLVSYQYSLKSLPETIKKTGCICIQSSSKFLNPFDDNNLGIKAIEGKIRTDHKKDFDIRPYLLDFVILAISRIK